MKFEEISSNYRLILSGLIKMKFHLFYKHFPSSFKYIQICYFFNKRRTVLLFVTNHSSTHMYLFSYKKK